MKPAIVLYKSIPADLRAKLDQHFTVHAFDGLQLDNAAFDQALQQAEGILGSGGKIDEAFCNAPPNCVRHPPSPSVTTTLTSQRSTPTGCC